MVFGFSQKLETIYSYQKLPNCTGWLCLCGLHMNCYSSVEVVVLCFKNKNYDSFMGISNKMNNYVTDNIMFVNG